MSATLLRPVPSASAPTLAPASVQVLAVWRAMPGAYLVLGRAPGPLPKSGSARLAKEPGAHGMFRTFFWPLGSDQAVGYLTVVRLPDRLPILDESEVVLRGARGADRDFVLRLTPISEEDEFGRHMASLAGASAAALARFLLDLIHPEAQTEVRRPIVLLESFLQHAARHEGCVELLLQIPDRILLLQGWGPTTGADVELILTGTSIERHSVQIGEFPRSDVQPPLTGSVLALPVDVADRLSTAQSIFLLTQDEILCRRVLDRRVHDPVSSAGQIRHLLPRLVCPPSLAATLQQALQPQFEGVDTLNKGERPVRAALDIAVAAEGAGLFLSGWVFDPTDQITRIECCAGNSAFRLDQECVRIHRDDVVRAFAADPTLPPGVRADIGFAVRAEIEAVADQPHLRFTFRDDDIAFLPLTVQRTSEPGIRARLCDSIDMHKPSGIEIVRQHLAPFLAKADPPPLTDARVIQRGPLDRPHAIVVPLGVPALPRAVIAGLLRDPLKSEEQIVFVSSAEWTAAQHETLLQLLQFYDLPATVIQSRDAVGPVDAAIAAAHHADADTFLLVSPAAAGGGGGSRQALRDAAEGVAAACPTVLYEDGSIRFAGVAELAFTDRLPFASLQARWLGLSGEHVATSEPVIAIGGTIEWCLLRREALAAAAPARRFATKFGQEAALFASLQENGCPVVWLPTVKIAAADDLRAEAPGSAAALVDTWALRANWGDT